ncbi:MULTISPECIES: AAA family ATPase [Vibrio]|jgi:MoxR-like ATPase|uniref:AAA family ATPase n=1 Tax=Vibrio TaxID=662 RepID=UPI0002EDD1FD|nr:MoxR family ATPase [Vibrio splendidus]MCC4881405.1 MoxR family ATPase [Vibrio splendidus]MDH5887896.1 MoxR family ATPase [Vibrio splendidus]MDH5914969.1 MoxR family ATPase [Vibrio splendidus]MDP2588073.1 MoxR family ATPase [Vibrio splendidus]PMP38826.1 AAA family ATPase [Vibrio splendidus]
MNPTLDSINQLKQQMESSVIGQQHMVDTLLVALLTNGNVLLEGLPGTAKTRSIKSLASALQVDLGRVQFTPDLLPSDVTGTEVYQDVDGKPTLTFQPGPVFNNLLLADEINRSPAKVQAALLEAMEERQITVAGKTYKLPDLFMVLATQNPVEQEGTYPLPEAQMDRFIMKINLDYPDADAEEQIIKMVRSEEKPSTDKPAPIDPQCIFDARDQLRDIHCSDAVLKYIVAIVVATRQPELYPESPLSQWIGVGSSPRATIALDKCSRAMAWLNGKDFVDPDDVRNVVHGVLRHRLILSYDALAEGVSSDRVIDEILSQVAVA